MLADVHFLCPKVGGRCVGLHIGSQSLGKTLGCRSQTRAGHRTGPVCLSTGETSAASLSWRCISPLKCTRHSTGLSCAFSFLSFMQWSWDVSAQKETWIEPGSTSSRYDTQTFTVPRLSRYVHFFPNSYSLNLNPETSYHLIYLILVCKPKLATVTTSLQIHQVISQCHQRTSTCWLLSLWPLGLGLLVDAEWRRTADQLPGAALLSGGHQADQHAEALGRERRPHPAHRDGTHPRQVKPLLPKTHFRQLLLGTQPGLGPAPLTATPTACARQGLDPEASESTGVSVEADLRCPFWL